MPITIDFLHAAATLVASQKMEDGKDLKNKDNLAQEVVLLAQALEKAWSEMQLQGSR